MASGIQIFPSFPLFAISDPRCQQIFVVIVLFLGLTAYKTFTSNRPIQSPPLTKCRPMNAIIPFSCKRTLCSKAMRLDHDSRPLIPLLLFTIYTLPFKTPHPSTQSIVANAVTHRILVNESKTSFYLALLLHSPYTLPLYLYFK